MARRGLWELIKPWQTRNSMYILFSFNHAGNESTGCRVHELQWRENKPRQPAASTKLVKVGKEWEGIDSERLGLEAAHPLKESV